MFQGSSLHCNKCQHISSTMIGGLAMTCIIRTFYFLGIHVIRLSIIVKRKTSQDVGCNFSTFQRRCGRCRPNYIFHHFLQRNNNTNEINVGPAFRNNTLKSIFCLFKNPLSKSSFSQLIQSCQKRQYWH